MAMTRLDRLVIEVLVGLEEFQAGVALEECPELTEGHSPCPWLPQEGPMA